MFRTQGVQITQAATYNSRGVVNHSNFTICLRHFNVGRTNGTFSCVGIVFARRIFVKDVGAISVNNATNSRHFPIRFVSDNVGAVVQTMRVSHFASLHHIPRRFFQRATGVCTNTTRLFNFGRHAFLTMRDHTISKNSATTTTTSNSMVVIFDRSGISLSLVATVMTQSMVNTDGNYGCSNAVRLAITYPIPTKADLLYDRNDALFVYYSDFRNKLVAVVPRTIVPQQSLSNDATDSVYEVLQVPITSES